MASKIKSALRTRCALAKGANILLAVSGGASSTSVRSRCSARDAIAYRVINEVAHIRTCRCACARSCLAHVLSAACDPAAQKRMFFGFDMVYVDESAIMVGTEQEVSTWTHRGMGVA